MRNLNFFFFGVIVLLLVAEWDSNRREDPPGTCTDVEFIHVTQRDGFYHCRADSTVWNPIDRRWEEPAIIDLRRINSGNEANGE